MAEILTVAVKCADIEEVKAKMNSLKAENARLRLRLEKVIEALSVDDVDVPCPSNVGLNDSYECGLSVECPQCWRDALEMVVVKSDDVIEVHPDGSGCSDEIVEMHQDGTLCNQCGIYMGEAVGHARLCVGCEVDSQVNQVLPNCGEVNECSTYVNCEGCPALERENE